MERTKLSMVVKALRKEYGLTQEDLAMKSGVGLCFVRNLEQGKQTLKMDKVNQLLDLFNYELTPPSSVRIPARILFRYISACLIVSLQA